MPRKTIGNETRTGNLTVTGTTTVGVGSATAPAVAPSGDTNTGLLFPAADTVAISAGGSERLRVDSSGRLLIGTTGGPTGIGPMAITIEGTNFAAGTIGVALNADNTNPSYLILRKSRGAAALSNTTVQSGDAIGRIQFSGADGSTNVVAVQLDGQADGPVTAGVVPGRFIVWTANSSGVLSERMRVDSTGRVGIGAAPSYKLDVFDATSAITRTVGHSTVVQMAARYSTDSAGPAIQLQKYRGSTAGALAAAQGDTVGDIMWQSFDGTSGFTTAMIKGAVDGTVSTGSLPGRLIFYTLPAGGALTERVRIDSAGGVYFGNGYVSATPAAAGLLGTSGFGTNISASEFRITAGAGTGTGTGGPITFFTAPAGTTGSTLNTPLERMRIDSSGRVGIGTNNPSTTLDVNGTINATTFTQGGSVIYSGREDDSNIIATQVFS